MALDKKSKPCYPIILHFKMDPEPESVYFSALFNGAGPGRGSRHLYAELSDTHTIYTNKHFWEGAHHLACHLAQACSCAHVCYAGAHTLRHTQTHRQTHNRNGGGVFFFFLFFSSFFRVTVTNKSSLK